MTNQKPIARFDCTCQEGHMAEEPAGEYVRYDDIKHLLLDEPPSKSDAEFLSLVGHCSNCSCQDCREFFKADARARVEPVAPHECRAIGMDIAVRGVCAVCDSIIAASEKPPADRKSALDEIVRISEEAGLYEDRPAKCANCGAPLYSGTCQCCATPVNRSGDA
jgi:hypothetical protein